MHKDQITIEALQDWKHLELKDGKSRAEHEEMRKLTQQLRRVGVLQFCHRYPEGTRWRLTPAACELLVGAGVA